MKKSTLLAYAVSACLSLLVSPSQAQNQKLADTRITPKGPEKIDCSTLFDSRCGNAIAATALPSCSVEISPPMVTISGGSPGIATVTANCSAGTTEYSWTVSNGSTKPNGKSSAVNYYNEGTICYTVAGKNPSANLNFGAESAPVCITVIKAALCATQPNYETLDSCSSGLVGAIHNVFSFNTSSCMHEYSYSYSDCRIGSCPDATTETVACTGGQIGSQIKTTSYSGTTCTANVSVSGTCSCPSGQSLIGGICTTSSITTCPSGQTLQNGVCVTETVNCPPSQSSFTVCPSGQSGSITQTTTYTGSSCTPVVSTTNSCVVTSCPASSTVNKSCGANENGTIIETTTYSAPPDCTPTITVDNQCTAIACPNPTIESLACPPTFIGEISITNTYTNPPTCTQSSFVSSNTCTCPEGTERSPTTNRCVPKSSIICTPPQILMNGSCVDSVSTVPASIITGSCLAEDPGGFGCTSTSTFDASTGTLKAIFDNANSARICIQYQYQLQTFAEGEFWVKPIATGSFTPCSRFGIGRIVPYVIGGETGVSGYCPKSGGCFSYASIY